MSRQPEHGDGGAAFVSTDCLAAHLSDPDLVVIDGSWYLPTQNRDGRREFEAGHIPGAVFFDLDALADTSSGLPHMLLDEDTFGEAAGRLGIPSDATLVVYDGSGLFSAPRVRWTLQVFGAQRVFLLAGGFPAWIAEGRPTETGPSRRGPAHFSAQRATEAVATLGTVQDVLATGRAQIVDARPAARFTGDAAEPRAGLRSGHMPGSRNVPFADLVEGGSLKAPDALREAFVAAGVDLDRPVVATCGSGVSAAILVLALDTIGRPGAALYDGSWAEYGGHPDLPVDTGPADPPRS